ncbi:MOSC domain-containing protein [Longispora albida]|uniref:MOSC domain-containing protein n=1 Tax=Longispora albida TaxID=203523 RepID=UPI0003798D10|nr:MOSC N-terminal beta barrel domain-containing protein [Longispora albida]
MTGMYIKELWRYPVKSMRGEQLEEAVLTTNGVAGDRLIHVRGSYGPLTARTRYGMLGLAATTGPDGKALINGRPWDDPVTTKEIRAVAGPDAEAVEYDGHERFDVLPLLVATDGALTAFGYDYRRLRPNIVIGGVPGLAERDWPGLALRAGGALIGMLKLRARCVVTTLDPDTTDQDLDVLRMLNRQYEGRFALDSWVAEEGTIRVGDPVELVAGCPTGPRPGGWIVGAPYTVP